MSKTIFMPKFRPGDIVGFKSGNDFVIGKVEFCRLVGEAWNYNIAGWSGYLEENQLYHFTHVVPGFRREIE